MWSILLAPIVLLAAWFAFFSLFDFNAHRQAVESFFARNVPGYQLTLVGRIEVSPWPLRVRVGPGAVYTRDYQPVLHWRTLQFELNPWASLRNWHWHFNEMVFISPSLHWMKRRQGDNTVLPLIQGLFDIRQPLRLAQLTLSRAWRVERFQVVDGRVHWWDQRTGERGRFRNIQVQLSDLVPGEPAMGAVSWTMMLPAVRGEVNFRGRGVLEGKVLRLMQWQGGVELEDPDRKRVPLYWQMQGREAALRLDTLSWKLMQMDAMAEGQRIRLQGQGQFLAGASSHLWLSFEHLNLPRWWRQWGRAWPKAWQDEVWRNVSGQVRFEWSRARQAFYLQGVKIGPARITGDVVQDVAANVRTLHLQLQHVALSVQEKAGERPAKTQATTSYLPLRLPAEWLAQSVQGTVTLRESRLFDQPVSRADMTLLSQPEKHRLVIAPLDFQAFGGEWLTQLTVETTHPWSLHWQGSVQHLDVAAWLRSHGWPDRLKGKANGQFDVQVQGWKPAYWRHQLAGTVQVEMEKGGDLEMPPPLGGKFDHLRAETRLSADQVQLDAFMMQRRQDSWQGKATWSLPQGKLTGRVHQRTGRAVSYSFQLKGTLRQPRLLPERPR